MHGDRAQQISKKWKNMKNIYYSYSIDEFHLVIIEFFTYVDFPRILALKHQFKYTERPTNFTTNFPRKM